MVPCADMCTHCLPKVVSLQLAVDQLARGSFGIHYAHIRGLMDVVRSATLKTNCGFDDATKKFSDAIRSRITKLLPGLVYPTPNRPAILDKCVGVLLQVDNLGAFVAPSHPYCAQDLAEGSATSNPGEMDRAQAPT